MVLVKSVQKLTSLLQLGTSGNIAPRPRISTVKLGVWEVAIESTARFRFVNLPNTDAERLLTHITNVRRFIAESYRAAPRQFIVYAIYKLWMSVEGGLSLYFRGRLMDAILRRFQGEKRNDHTVIKALFSQMLLMVMKGILQRVVRRENEIFSDRVKFHFMTNTLHSRLFVNSNSVTESEKSTSRITSPGNREIWNAFEGLSSMLWSISRASSQLYFGFKLVKSQPVDPIFLAASMAHPFIAYSRHSSLYSHKYVSYCVNATYKRLLALRELAKGDSFYKDIQSDGVGPYIEKEFKRCRDEIGDICTAEPHEQWRHHNSVVSNIGYEILSTLPTLYFAIRAVAFPGSLTLGSYTLLQDISQTVSFTVYLVSYEAQRLIIHLTAIKELYKSLDDVDKIKDGNLSYSSSSEKGDSGIEMSSGMTVEFRNVSFAYPGTSKKALSDISFTIKRGQLVAIVGVNGSGKSSIVNLFNRLYDPTEGEVLIDGIPLPSYRVSEVRRSMAILRQSHPLYPLSLRENVVLGLPDREVSEEDIEAALASGGAQDFVNKLPDKLDTVLNPVKTIRGSLRAEDNEGVKPIYDTEIVKDVSGGENQRLAASRTFMRLRGNNIKLLAADEPTSALDPEGEYALFSNLKQQRGGMTVVFITHRFGHVTRHADLILCMKDGSLVEQGTHEELIAKGSDSEYYKLHSVQAKAFAEPSTISEL